MSTEKIDAGSNLPQEVITIKLAEHKKETGAPGIAAASWSGWGLWRGNGATNLNITSSGIHANSRVFASISEYNTDPNLNRFSGNAYLFIYSVSPYNGGVVVKLNVGWNTPLNICVSLLVDP